MANLTVDICLVLGALYLPGWCLVDYISMAHKNARQTKAIKKEIKHYTDL